MGGQTSRGSCGYCDDDRGTEISDSFRDSGSSCSPSSASSSNESGGWCLCNSYVPAAPLPPVASLTEAEDRLLRGLPVMLILFDKTRLRGKCRVNPRLGTIMLSCNRKLRTISFSSIGKLLHTPAELERVEQKAGSSNHYRDNCVAVQLKETHSCIPLFFEDLQDKLLFLHVVGSGMGVQLKPVEPRSAESTRTYSGSTDGGNKKKSDASTQTKLEDSEVAVHQQTTKKEEEQTDKKEALRKDRDGKETETDLSTVASDVTTSDSPPPPPSSSSRIATDTTETSAGTTR